MPIEMLLGFTANISMETQIQQNRRYTTIQLDIIHTGDCLKILKTLPDDSVHCCVTSPPYYALRDYGMEAQIGRETTPKEYISRLTEVFTEVRRVLRPDGTLWLNISDTYAGKGNQGDFIDPKNPTGRNGQAVALNNKVEGCKPKDMIGIADRSVSSVYCFGGVVKCSVTLADIPSSMPVTGFREAAWVAASKKLWQSGADVFLSKDGETFKELKAADYIPVGATLNVDGIRCRIDAVDFAADEVRLTNIEDKNRPIRFSESIQYVRAYVEDAGTAIYDTIPKKPAARESIRDKLKSAQKAQPTHTPKPQKSKGKDMVL